MRAQSSQDLNLAIETEPLSPNHSKFTITIPQADREMQETENLERSKYEHVMSLNNVPKQKPT